MGSNFATVKEIVLAVVVNWPPNGQTAIGPPGLVITNPAGKVSVKLIPVNFAVLSIFRLVIVNVSTLVPFSATLSGENDFKSFGGPTTVMSALAGELGTVLLAVRTALLVYLAGAIPIRSIPNMQVVLSGKLESVNIMEPLPAGAVIVAPAQPAEVRILGTGATVRKSTKLSTMRILFIVLVLTGGFPIVKVSLVKPISGICAGKNCLLKDAGATTAIVAVADPEGNALVPVSFEVRGPAVTA